MRHPKNLENDIFQPKKQQNRVTDNDDAVFTLVGKQDYFDEERYPIIEDLDQNGQFVEAEERDQAYALRRVGTDMTRYYLKFGGPGGRLFDPMSVDGDRYGRKLLPGLGEYRWREVNRKAFSYYINFLKTKNKAYLRNAEREAM